jgi:CheY-like chemotaxis protein
VDDQQAALDPLQTLLEDAGAETVVAISVDEALDAIQKRPPAVIVSDIGMPGRDGYDLLRSVRALPASRGGKIPMIALTAFVSAEDRDRALSEGFQEHLSKPVEGARLIAAVAALLPGAADSLPSPSRAHDEAGHTDHSDPV